MLKNFVNGKTQLKKIYPVPECINLLDNEEIKNKLI